MDDYFEPKPRIKKTIYLFQNDENHLYEFLAYDKPLKEVQERFKEYLGDAIDEIKCFEIYPEESEWVSDLIEAIAERIHRYWTKPQYYAAYEDLIVGIRTQDSDSDSKHKLGEFMRGIKAVVEKGEPYMRED